jgi:HAD superfamily hydrolase (TIGR01509 family)
VPRIKQVIFDLDGTLVDAFKAVTVSLNHALKEKGYSVFSHETIKRKVGWGDRHLVSCFVKPKDVDAVLAVYRRHHRMSLKRGVKFLPGAKKILTDLKKKKYKLAVASNRPTFFSHIILRTLKARKYFHCVLCADRVKNPKPAPDLLRQILKKSALKPKDALYVGDMTIDAETGRRARMRTVIVLTGSNSHRQVAPFKPFKIIRQLRELAPILSSLR